MSGRERVQRRERAPLGLLVPTRNVFGVYRLLARDHVPLIDPWCINRRIGIGIIAVAIRRIRIAPSPEWDPNAEGYARATPSPSGVSTPTPSRMPVPAPSRTAMPAPSSMPLRTDRRGEGEQGHYRHRTDQRSAKSHSISPFFNLRKHSTTSSLCIKKSLQLPTKTTSGFTITSSPACSRNSLCTTLACLADRTRPQTAVYPKLAQSLPRPGRRGDRGRRRGTGRYSSPCPRKYRATVASSSPYRCTAPTPPSKRLRAYSVALRFALDVANAGSTP
jgi:hypothetical protein